MALFGAIATVEPQAPQSRGFQTAFGYVRDTLRGDSAARKRLDGAAAGYVEKFELEGGVFAIEQVYEARARAEGFFESHRKFIDVQAVVAGEELMEVVDISRATVRDPYDAARDLIVYVDAPNASRLHIRAGEVAIFHPNDIHMPSLRVNSTAALVRKVVVKIPVA